jgi:hypothetical protein
MTQSDVANSVDPVIPAMRACSDLVKLWGLCRTRACRRAGACHGDPHECLARYAPLLPDDVRAGAAAMIEGWRLGLDFDELCEDAEAELEAFGAWSLKIEAAAGMKPDEGD